MNQTMRIAISACLLGQNVRYDGKHKLQAWLESVDDIEWIPICPEVEAGMPVPREKIQLELVEGELKLRAIVSRKDWSEKMDIVAAQWIEQLQLRQVCGYVFKSRSPSCGVHGVPVFAGVDQHAVTQGQGRFAQRVSEAMPALPLFEETQMGSAIERQEFIRRAWEFHQRNHNE